MSENVKASFYLPEALDVKIEALVEKGVFTTKSDVYQEALRRLLLEYQEFSPGSGNNGSEDVDHSSKQSNSSGK